MSETTIQHFPKTNSNVVSRLVEGKDATDLEAVLVLAEKGQVKVLNAMGARIWSIIDGKRKVGELVDLIHAEYAVDWEEAFRDSVEFLDELATKGFVTIELNTNIGYPEE